MSRRWPVALLVTVVLYSSTAAWASFADTTTASGSYTSGTLAPTTNPNTSAGTCTALSTDRIVVTWTATTSTWADGYEISRSVTSGGPYAVVGAVSGRSTTSYTDNGPLSFNTTYYYVVRATKSAWRSADTSQVSRTTRSSLCV